MAASNSLSVAADATAQRLARAWLALGVAALIISGLLAVLLVLARTPGLQDFFPRRDFFRSALVVHVDLSVLIWFMAFAAVLWSLVGRARLLPLGWGGLGFAVAGTLLMSVSPFLPGAAPLLNNYLPVLDQDYFLAGLALAGVGFALTVLRSILVAWPRLSMDQAGAELQWGIYMAALTGALAFAAMLMSLAGVPDITGTALYETVFWGPGHALQFQHALLLLVAWWWLAGELGAPPRCTPRRATLLFALAAAPVLAVPVIYALWPVGSAMHVSAFVWLMQAGHTLMLPLIVLVALALLRTWPMREPAAAALWSSFLLFLCGGVLGYLIHGVNVVIPAHYHGSIVGITLAFMGLTYLLLPRLGYAAADGRTARLQPYVYGGGQLLHILGLAWSGGYGVQRKVAGADQVLSNVSEKVAMGMMGLGGAIAIVGGIMFVWVCLVAMLGRRRAKGRPEFGAG